MPDAQMPGAHVPGGGPADRRTLGRRFETARPRLVALASRLLGTSAEADDVVQEAWLRLERVDVAQIDNLDAWLTTVVSRLCLDVLGSARRTRERWWQVQPWADEPVDPAPSPLDEAERGEAVSAALSLVLDTLSPAERIAFVLHDVFGRSFDDVAHALGRTPTAARQLASRARRRIRDADAERPRRDAREREVVQAWLRAAEHGDLDRLLELLDDDAVLVADYGTAAGSPGGPGDRSGLELRGRDEIAGQAVLSARLAAGSELVRVDGRPGVVARVAGRVVSIMVFELQFDGDAARIRELRVLADPARL